jgi:endoglucanase
VPRALIPLILGAVVTLATLASGPAPAPAAAIEPPLSTSGSRIIDARGRTVVLAGVNWFGFETANHVVHGLWTRDLRDVLAQVRALGFNTIRLPFSLQALRSPSISGVDFSGGRNAALRGAGPQEAMDVFVDEAARQGLLVILDNHSGPDDGYTEPLWYGRGYSEEDWVDAWTALARRYRDRPNVVGADLKNEPHGEATWGTGGRTDWRRAATRAGNAVLSVAPHWLILVEGIGGSVAGERLSIHWWGGNLQGVRRHPVRLSRPSQLVYSPHEYGPGVFDQPWFRRPDMARVLADRWHKEFGFIAEQGIAPLLVGEFGGRAVDTASTEGRWQRQFLDYLGRTGTSWTYWALNPNSGDTGGILQDDWTTVEGAKMELLSRLIQRRRIAGGSGPAGPRPAKRRPRRAPARPPAGAGAISVEEESRWTGGSCARIVVRGADRRLGGTTVTVELPSGTRIAQSWNAETSGTTGRVTLSLPSWAAVEGGAAYTATGFCLAGPGRARVAR